MVQNILNEMRYAEVVFLLHRANEESNTENYHTTLQLQFAGLLFTTNHCTKYARSARIFFIYWHWASEADRTIYEILVMMRRTKARKTIYMDRFIE